MRKIKFRAWNTDTKQIVDLHKITPLALAIDPSIVGARTGVYVPDDDRIKVMQFTGLHDKNGKEIYEGDIVRRIIRTSCCKKIEQDDTGVVEWLDCGWSFRNEDGWSYGWANRLNEDIEVIGNIYENPELLEVKG